MCVERGPLGTGELCVRARPARCASLCFTGRFAYLLSRSISRSIYMYRYPSRLESIKRSCRVHDDVNDQLWLALPTSPSHSVVSAGCRNKYRLDGCKNSYAIPSRPPMARSTAEDYNTGSALFSHRDWPRRAMHSTQEQRLIIGSPPVVLCLTDVPYCTR